MRAILIVVRLIAVTCPMLALVGPTTGADAADWPPLSVVTVADELREQGIRVGPAMSAEINTALIAKPFFRRLNLDDRALGPIRDLVHTGQYEQALDAYRDLVVNRLARLDLGALMLGGCYQKIENLTNNLVAIEPANYSVALEAIGRPGSIVWFKPGANPERAFGPTGGGLGGLVWNCNLMRAFAGNDRWPVFARTLNPAYLRQWAAIYEDFAFNYRPQYEAAKAAGLKDLGSYYGLWIATRSDTFITALHMAAHASPELTKQIISGKQLAILLSELVQQPNNQLVVSRFNTVSGNQAVMANQSLIKAFLALPEWRDAAAWRDSVRAAVLASLCGGTLLADGSDKEQSFNYNTGVAGVWSDMRRLIAQQNGFEDVVAALDRAVVLRQRFLAAIQRPSGVMTHSLLPGASCQGYGGPVKELVRPDRSTLGDPLVNQIDAHIYSNGPAPAFTSVCFPYGGWTAMRSGWKDDALHLFFKNSRLPGGHYDLDWLAVQVTAYGRTMLVDAGPSNYGEDFANAYLVSSFGHNTIVVDDCNQSIDVQAESGKCNYNRPIEARWHSSARFDFVEGAYPWRYDRQGIWLRGKPQVTDVIHRREVLFMRELGLWVITDSMESTNTHRYTQIWNFSHLYSNDMVRADNSQQRIWTADPAGPNVWLHQFAAEPPRYPRFHGQTNPEVRGWYKGFYAQPAIKKVDIHAGWLGAGNQLLVTLIATAKGTNSPVESVKKQKQAEAMGFRARLAGGTSVTYLAASNVQKLNAGPVTIMGRRLLVVQEDAGLIRRIVLKIMGHRLPAAQEDAGLIRGIALDCESFHSAGQQQTIHEKDFEFELRDNKLVQTTAIRIPAGFRWKETPQGFVPDYGRDMAITEAPRPEAAGKK